MVAESESWVAACLAQGVAGIASRGFCFLRACGVERTRDWPEFSERQLAGY